MSLLIAARACATAERANGAASDADTISFASNNTLEDGGTVSCSFSIYDQPSQAQAGGSTGRIYTTGFQDFIDRAPSFVFVGKDGEATADVEAVDGAYFHFIGDDVPLGESGARIARRRRAPAAASS